MKLAFSQHRYSDGAPKESFEESLAFMPLVRFTQNIQRHVPCPPRTVSGRTVRAALEAYFLDHPDPGARGYVLDDQGRLRKHMMIFVAGRVIADRVKLSDAVAEDGTIDVMQALSGG